MQEIKTDNSVPKATVIHPSNMSASAVKLARLIAQRKGMGDLGRQDLPTSLTLFSATVTRRTSTSTSPVPSADCSPTLRATPRERSTMIPRRTLLSAAALALPLAATTTAHAANPAFRVLVFSKTTGYRHASIPDGIAAIEKLGQDNGFAVDATEDATQFNDANLTRYQTVVFLSTTGDPLDQQAEKDAFQRYIQHGGGYVGIHAAADSGYNWAWYGGLVGAYFRDHPAIQQATVDVAGQGTAATRGLPNRWTRTDEWYNYSTNPRPQVRVLATLDERTYNPVGYTGGSMGSDHPISWCHPYDGGRAFYTGMGHTSESYTEPLFLSHILGGIKMTAGGAKFPEDTD